MLVYADGSSQVYHLKAELGRATDDFSGQGRLIERTTYRKSLFWLAFYLCNQYHFYISLVPTFHFLLKEIIADLCLFVFLLIFEYNCQRTHVNTQYPC